MKKFCRTALLGLLTLFCLVTGAGEVKVSAAAGDYIKWIDFTPTYRALCDTLEADIKSHESGSSHQVSWIELLAALAAANGGNFASYRSSDTEKLLAKAAEGEDVASLVKNKKLYAYYLEAYGAVLGGMVGSFTEVSVSPDGSESRCERYGLRAFSPVAAGYYYNDFDDFGSSRSFGYKRRHLGHDMLGSIGTPIIAVESGYVSSCGWNRFGGWRIGIKSFDGKRYHYYAHLRKNHPYNDMYEGKIVNAGEVIGYLGMTGYSSKENTNNINIPHLHYGLQIIFDKSQEEGWNQIWIDVYPLTRFLAHNRSRVFKDREAGESYSRVYYLYEETPD